jgi:transcriptional regulator with XRE-family HTH domain
MEDRVRGNPPGATCAHVAANLKTARRAIGMDLRTFADKVKEAGRAMSAAALSKIENGDRRVDVDDLAVFAYVLATTPAALLTPPPDAGEPTGVPADRFMAEEVEQWARGMVVLTTEDLLRYWRDQAFYAASLIERLETAIARQAPGAGSPDNPPEPYTRRITAQRERLTVANTRIIELDPLADTIGEMTPTL